MKILDYFEHPQFGMIVSTAAPEFDCLSDDEIKKRVGDKIIISDANSHELKTLKVSNVEIATSLVGKKNINICLSDSIKLSDLKLGSEIRLPSQAGKNQLTDTNVLSAIYEDSLPN